MLERLACPPEVVKAITENQIHFMNYATSLCNNRTLAEDVLQEAMTSAFKSGHLFEGRGDVNSWLRKIIKNKAKSHFRAANTRHLVSDPDHELTNSLPDPSDIEQSMIDEDIQKRLQDIIGKLSQIHRDVMQMVLQDISHENISQALGIPPETVRTRIFYAIKTIKSLMLKEPSQSDSTAETKPCLRKMIRRPDMSQTKKKASPAIGRVPA